MNRFQIIATIIERPSELETDLFHVAVALLNEPTMSLAVLIDLKRQPYVALHEGKQIFVEGHFARAAKNGPYQGSLVLEADLVAEIEAGGIPAVEPSRPLPGDSLPGEALPPTVHTDDTRDAVAVS